MKTIFTIVLFSTFALASADENVLNVSNVSRENGVTKVSLSREVSKYNLYTDSIQSYQLGAFTKTFKGSLSDKEIVSKVSLFVDNFITVKSGNTTSTGKVQDLASSRSKAFFDNGYEGYFAELAKQLSDEK